jgi:hypothetical protein
VYCRINIWMPVAGTFLVTGKRSEMLRPCRRPGFCCYSATRLGSRNRLPNGLWSRVATRQSPPSRRVSWASLVESSSVRTRRPATAHGGKAAPDRNGCAAPWQKGATKLFPVTATPTLIEMN